MAFKKVQTLAAALVCSAALAFAAPAARATTAYDATIQTEVQKKLASKSKLRDVRASAEDGIVTLNGTVGSLADKLDAGKRAKKVDHVEGVRNALDVAGPVVEDAKLQDQLARKLTYDRVGYWNMFDALGVTVQNGVASVSGVVREPVAKDSALATVTHTAGVKDVIDRVKVAPTSIFDDDLRLRLARAIYGDSVLGRYAIDPAKPIRIVVENGHVGLFGTVDSRMDKQIAALRANSVFGAFSVDNQLTVAGEGRVQ